MSSQAPLDHRHPIQTAKTRVNATEPVLYPASADVDIAVLETTFAANEPYSAVKVRTGTNGGPTFGQNVWFLGFPFIEGLGSVLANGVAVPFIKRGTLSAIDYSKTKTGLLYIDGFNNPGFRAGRSSITTFNFTASSTWQPSSG